MAKQLSAAQVAAISKPGAYLIETGLYTFELVGGSLHLQFPPFQARQGTLALHRANARHHANRPQRPRPRNFAADLLNGRELGEAVKAPDFAEMVRLDLPTLICRSRAKRSAGLAAIVRVRIAAEHFGKKPINEIDVADVCSLLGARPLYAGGAARQVAARPV